MIYTARERVSPTATQWSSVSPSRPIEAWNGIPLCGIAATREINDLDPDRSRKSERGLVREIIVGADQDLNQESEPGTGQGLEMVSDAASRLNHPAVRSALALFPRIILVAAQGIPVPGAEDGLLLTEGKAIKKTQEGGSGRDRAAGIIYPMAGEAATEVVPAVWTTLGIAQGVHPPRWVCTVLTRQHSVTQGIVAPEVGSVIMMTNEIIAREARTVLTQLNTVASDRLSLISPTGILKENLSTTMLGTEDWCWRHGFLIFIMSQLNSARI